MAGFIPGLLPTTHSQEKEFAQAYEDVLERYKGKRAVGEPRPHQGSIGNEDQLRRVQGPVGVFVSELQFVQTACHHQCLTICLWMFT